MIFLPIGPLTITKGYLNIPAQVFDEMDTVYEIRVEVYKDTRMAFKTIRVFHKK